MNVAERVRGPGLALLVAMVLASLVPVGPAAAAATVERVAGDDRVLTAIALSGTGFPDGAPAAVVARDRAFADALAAAPLAAAAGGPVLLNPVDRLRGEVRDELDRLGASTVYLMGGPAAQSSAVQDELESAGLAVERVEDPERPDRFGTAAEAARLAVARWRETGDGDAGRHALVALGTHANPRNAWPDALAAGPLAGYAHAPVLLVAQDEVPEATNAVLDELGTQVVTIVGGPAAIPPETAEQVGDAGTQRERVGGATRYDTGQALATAAVEAGAAAERIVVATGQDYPDSLAAGPAAVAAGGVLVLAHGDDLDRSPEAVNWLWTRRDRIALARVAGGTVPVTAATQAQLDGLLNGIDGLDLGRVEVGSFDTPLGVFAPPGDGRLFVIERGGRVRVVVGGEVQPTPFLDIADQVSTGGERGLLGLAFHPGYADNGRFFVHYTDEAGDTVLSEWRVSGNANLADHGSEVVLASYDQPASNHNGGSVFFGTDQLLYLALGDGGGSGDQFGNGQDPDTPLGALLRFNVSRPGRALPAQGNPFPTGGAPELWAYGLRNPFRASEDPVTRTLFVADVGQGSWEEVDAAPIGRAGLNYGWSCREGAHDFPGGASCAPDADLVEPVVEYSHDGGHCSVIGGHVYRGAEIGELRGHYLYGDFCTGVVRSFRLLNGVAVQPRDWTAELGVGTLYSFGRDDAGELYLMNGSTVYRIVRG